MESIPQAILTTLSPLAVALKTNELAVQVRLSGQTIVIMLDDAAGQQQSLCQLDAETAAQLADVLGDFARSLRADNTARSWSARMWFGLQS